MALAAYTCRSRGVESSRYGWRERRKVRAGRHVVTLTVSRVVRDSITVTAGDLAVGVILWSSVTGRASVSVRGV